MRISFPLLLLLTASAVSAADVRAVRVWPGYRTEDSFVRLSEYFGKGENAGNEKVFRSQAGSREGFYFFARVNNEGPSVAAASIELSVIYPTDSKPRVFNAFPKLDLASGSNRLNIGLTGADWTGPKVNPVAWQLRLLAADGSELLREQSFLWR